MINNIPLQYKMTRSVGLFGAFIGWITIILQFILMLQNSENSVSETIIRFFSYYTILTNILVACCFTAAALKGEGDKQSFFTKPGVLAATLVYITIVGAVYNLVLRKLWTPTGLQYLVDESLHTVIPLLYIAFWLIVAVKDGLNWRSIFAWLIYPLGYFLFILIRGTISGFYPYPFIDVVELGWNKVIANSLFITGAFIILSLFIIMISKMKSFRKES